MRIAKAVAAAVGMLATATTDVLADNVLELPEVASLASVAVVALGTVWAVYRVPNKAPAGS